MSTAVGNTAATEKTSEATATAADVYPMKCRRPKVVEGTCQPLLELLIMVKNAGPGFRNMLEHNLQFVDSWAVLDTGSTDGVTLETIRELQHKYRDLGKPGFLYEEPFINFRDSRNRLLELRANSECFFQIILDDTYWLENGAALRSFLDLVRYEEEPVTADSFSLFIKSTDMAYLSNRIIKTRGVPSRGPHDPTGKPLRYDPRFRIHEIIRPNKTYSLPEKFGYIRDVTSDYMVARTKERKLRDLEMLYADLAALPGSLRVMYYLAETYLCQQNYTEAAKWYAKRANDPNPYAEADDYDEERYDAKYKLAVLHYVHLKSPWEGTCLELFLAAYAFMPKRPEALFMIGYHYNSVGSMALAYVFLKAAFEIGPPVGSHGMNLILDQYYFHAPRLLAPLCLVNHNYQLGEKAIRRLFDYYAAAGNPPPQPVAHLERLLKMFQLMNVTHPPLSEVATKKFGGGTLSGKRRFIVFVTSCGWKPFSGKTLRKKGLGGSETCIIQLAEHIARVEGATGTQPIIFCPCDEPSMEFRGVWYENYTAYPAFLRFLVDGASAGTDLTQHRVFLQRTTEYMWMTSEMKIPFYLHLHDIIPDQEVLVGHTGKDSSFRGVICLSEFHRGLFLQQFGFLADQTYVLGYGMPDWAEVATEEEEKLTAANTTTAVAKTPHSFIFPSFPNRGLLVLLRDLWGRILERYPDAKLFLFCDFQNQWLRNVAGADIQQIEQLLERYSGSIKNLGWQNPHILKSFWQRAEYWIYPCTFAETFCLTALEAQFYNCKAITCDLGALPETGRYGARIIPGDPREKTWQDQVLEAVFAETETTAAPPKTPFPMFSGSVTQEFLRRFC